MSYQLHNRRIAIISSYFQGERYGLLGPQMAATVIKRHSPYESIVIALPTGYNKIGLKREISNYFGSRLYRVNGSV
jgi:hypothetical protein